MSEKERVMKAVGILLSELNSQYEGTVNLSTAQLILLGEKATPYMISFLIDKTNFHKDLCDYIKEIIKMDKKFEEMGNMAYHPRNQELRFKKVEDLNSKFKKKWGKDPIIPRGTWYDIKADPQELILIERVLRVFEYIDDKEGINLAKNLISSMDSMEKLNR